MKKNFKTAIGMMSGTSLDGIDAALVHIDDDFNFEFIQGHSICYPDEVRKKLLEMANNNAATSDVCNLDFVVGRLFAQCANELMQKAGLCAEDIDYIASHGQTVFHIPQEIETGGIKTRSTLQIGNISVISQLTGVTTVGDFRSKDIAAGGQGAPLVPFADELIFKKDKNRAIQNIGGIGNVTVLSKDCDTFAFDTGPGNMLIDYCVQKFFNMPYDKGGEIALKGKFDEDWLQSLMDELYYSMQPPKSTGRELFNNDYAQKILKNAPENKFDIIATITALTAKTIFDAYRHFVLPKTSIQEIVLGGGGAYNKALIKYLNSYFNNTVIIKTHKDFGIDDKFKEAIAFAMLGFCTLNKKCNNLELCTGAQKRVIMGLISYS